METRHKYEVKRQESEMLSRAKLDRENQDLKLEQMKLQAEQDRETTLKSLIEKRETIISSIKYFFFTFIYSFISTFSSLLILFYLCSKLNAFMNPILFIEFDCTVDE